jgi:hypothetical protein
LHHRACGRVRVVRDFSTHSCHSWCYMIEFQSSKAKCERWRGLACITVTKLLTECFHHHVRFWFVAEGDVGENALLDIVCLNSSTVISSIDLFNASLQESVT